VTRMRREDEKEKGARKKRARALWHPLFCVQPGTLRVCMCACVGVCVCVCVCVCARAPGVSRAHARVVLCARARARVRVCVVRVPRDLFGRRGSYVSYCIIAGQYNQVLAGLVLRRYHWLFTWYSSASFHALYRCVSHNQWPSVCVYTYSRIAMRRYAQLRAP